MKLLIVCLFFSFFTFSQNFKSIKVEYSTILEPVLTKKYDDDKFNELNRKINESLNNKSFYLEANSKGFIFSESEIIRKDEEQEKIEKLANSIYTINSFYYSKSGNELYKVLDDVSIKVNNEFNWILLEDSKTIDNYICYKATCTISFKTRYSGTGTKEITVWYTPEINFNYGPNGYMGLPGLILELEYNKTKLVAKKIEFFKEENKIYIPNNKIITEEEYIKKLKENSPF
ncbi:MAG: GLPGLI family protein [Flavobacteriaceae bacterium]|nr:GLPGLI family protein [Flavobacteriaceae bacterium]